MNNLRKTLNILASNQYVKKIDKDILLLGINNKFRDKFIHNSKYLEAIELFNPTMSSFAEVDQKVNSHEIVGAIYDNIVMNPYLFYTPYKGEIICRNNLLINNIQKMFENKNEEDKWLLQIK